MKCQRNHHSKTAVKEQEEADKSPTEEGSLTRQKSVDELKQDCIYKKMIITDYVALDQANNSTQLQVSMYKLSKPRKPTYVHNGVHLVLLVIN